MLYAHSKNLDNSDGKFSDPGEDLRSKDIINRDGDIRDGKDGGQGGSKTNDDILIEELRKNKEWLWTEVEHLR